MGGSTADAIHGTTHGTADAPLKRAGRLNNWSVHYRDGNPYYPPEMMGVCLTGATEGHPERPDGDQVRTNRVVAASGRFVTTASGSIYELGTVSPDYRAWVESQGRVLDEEQPVKITTLPEPQDHDEAEGVEPFPVVLGGEG